MVQKDCDSELVGIYRKTVYVRNSSAALCTRTDMVATVCRSSQTKVSARIEKVCEVPPRCEREAGDNRRLLSDDRESDIFKVGAPERTHALLDCLPPMQMDTTEWS